MNNNEINSHPLGNGVVHGMETEREDSKSCVNRYIIP